MPRRGELRYFNPVIFFTLLLVLAGNLQESFFFWRLRVIREDMRNTQKIADAAREAANEKTALLAELTNYLEPELLKLITSCPLGLARPAAHETSATLCLCRRYRGRCSLGAIKPVY